MDRRKRFKYDTWGGETVACEQALLFGRVKPVSRERARLASLAQIGELARRLEKRRQTLCFKKYRDT